MNSGLMDFISIVNCSFIFHLSRQTDKHRERETEQQEASYSTFLQPKTTNTMVKDILELHEHRVASNIRTGHG